MKRIVVSLLILCIAASAQCIAASFDGNSRVEVEDTSGGLSWNQTNNALTVECWFRISIPSGTTITTNMVILVDRKTGSESDPYAYFVQFNVNSGNVEFQTHEGSNLDLHTLVERPYLDRWYHVAALPLTRTKMAFRTGGNCSMA